VPDIDETTCEGNREQGDWGQKEKEKGNLSRKIKQNQKEREIF